VQEFLIAIKALFIFWLSVRRRDEVGGKKENWCSRSETKEEQRMGEKEWKGDGVIYRLINHQ